MDRNPLCVTYVDTRRQKPLCGTGALVLPEFHPYAMILLFIANYFPLIYSPHWILLFHD